MYRINDSALEFHSESYRSHGEERNTSIVTRMNGVMMQETVFMF